MGLFPVALINLLADVLCIAQSYITLEPSFSEPKTNARSPSDYKASLFLPLKKWRCPLPAFERSGISIIQYTAHTISPFFNLKESINDVPMERLPGHPTTETVGFVINMSISLAFDAGALGE